MLNFLDISTFLLLIFSYIYAIIKQYICIYAHAPVASAYARYFAHLKNQERK